MFRFFLFFTLVAGFHNLIGQPSWSYTNTGTNHTILIPDSIQPVINGIPIDSGDYIGVFFEEAGDYFCGGYVIWEGQTTAISAWGNDPLTPEQDGFLAGEAFLIMVWRAEDDSYCPAVAGFSSLFPSGGQFQSDGMSALSSLQGMEPLELGPDIAQCPGNPVVLEAGFYLSYLWSDGSSGSGISLSQSGLVSLTVTTPFGEMTDQINLTIYPEPDPQITGEPISDTSFVLNASSGFASYEWSNGASGPSITVTQNGVYGLTVTSTEGCTASTSFTVTGLGVQLPTLDFVPSILYQNNGVILSFRQPVSGQASILGLDGRLLGIRSFRYTTHWEMPIPPPGSLISVDTGEWRGIIRSRY